MSIGGPVRTPFLRTASLSLHPFDDSFLTSDYVGWLNDPEIVRFSEQRHRRHDIESCRTYVDSFDHLDAHLWAICTSEGSHVGNISAHRDLPNCTVDVGILIGEKSMHGRGFGTQAWRAVCDWLIASGARKVTAGAMEVNLPMLKVFERCGMIIEARLCAQFIWERRYVDMIRVAKFA
jgi:RimJ/RimL family protein N-acetyltransferase